MRSMSIDLSSRCLQRPRPDSHAYVTRHNHIVQAAVSLLKESWAALLCSNPYCEWCVRSHQVFENEGAP